MLSSQTQIKSQRELIVEQIVDEVLTNSELKRHQCLDASKSSRCDKIAGSCRPEDAENDFVSYAQTGASSRTTRGWDPADLRETKGNRIGRKFDNMSQTTAESPGRQSRHNVTGKLRTS